MPFSQPPFGLRIFLSVYTFLTYLQARKLPKFKGLFYTFYSRIPDKKGIVRIKTLVGTAMYIDLADSIISTKLLEYGYWEQGLTDIVQKLVKPGMRVLDVGAHSGYYTLLFSKLVSETGYVVAFEPDPHNYDLLRANITASSTVNCNPVRKAVSNQAGTLPLYRDPENLGAHSLIDYGHGKAEASVEVTTLDEYCRGSSLPVDFIKMDIEGNEMLALEGARETIQRNPDIVLVVEFNLYIFEKINRHPQQFIDILKGSGMHLFVVPYGAGELEEVQDLASIPAGVVLNLLCVRDPNVLSRCGVKIL